MDNLTILLADNDQEFLESRGEFLQEEGFNVVKVSDSTQARRKLEEGDVDLAILDIRLENDADDHDLSGLRVAQEAAKQIPTLIASGYFQDWVPTIMLTGFPSYEDIREALEPKVGEIPATVAFISKQEGPEAMLVAVRKALKLKETGVPFIARTPEENNKSERKWFPITALVFLFASVVTGIVAMTINDPRWLAGTAAFGILFAIFTWVIAR